MSSRLFFMFFIALLVFIACGEPYYRQGERIYTASCASCHMDDGSGLSQLIPALKFEQPIDSFNLQKYVCIIRYGIDNQDSIIQMPPQPELSDIAITNVINYMLNDMNDIKQELTLPQTKRFLSKCDQ